MIAPGTPIEALDTPVQIVDLDKLEANIRRLQAAIAATGAKLRPHIKTHKIPEIARMQLAAGGQGIAVSKVAEAEVFAAAGFDDIVVAYPVVGPEKWRRLAELARTCRVTVNVDSEIAARGMSEAARAAGTVILAQVDIDTGFHRCGVQPNNAEALCRCIRDQPGLELDGITTHRSAFFPDHGGRPVAELGREEGQIMAALAERLRHAGIPIREVTCGSTPTAVSAAAVDGVTEVRAGTYVFGDLIMAGVGAIAREDISLTILSTVQSRPHAGRATMDGGMKTFMGEAFPSPPKFLKGFGEAVDLPIHLEGLTEEHGLAALPPDVQPEIGDRIAFFPNHVCTTVNLSDEIVGVRNGRVEVVWPVAARQADVRRGALMAKHVISTRGAGPPLGAYSQGWRVGDFVYTAGTGPIDPETGKVVGETLEEQTRRVLDSIKAVLEAGGATMDDVFKVNVYLANPGMFPRFNAVYAEYFKDPKPARTTVGAHLDQVPGMLVEIEAIAYVGDDANGMAGHE